MKYIKTILINFIFIAAFLNSCNDYVTNVEDLVDVVKDERLDNEKLIPVQITGVKQLFASSITMMATNTDGLSDQLFFDTNIPQATFSSFIQIEAGDILFTNSSAEQINVHVGKVRKIAAFLAERVESIGDFSDQNLKTEALFTSHFYRAMADYCGASYIGLTEDQGGIPINNGPFIPSDQVYDLAIQNFLTAITYSPDDHHTRVINTLIARIYLFKGDYTNASTYAAIGLTSGDAPFQALYSETSGNYYYFQAGVRRTQWAADWRFKQYIDDDSTEANRILLDTILGNDTTTLYYRQHKYPTIESPFNIATWQENHLIMAELSLRGQGSGDPETLINEVRTSHGVADITGTVDLDAIYIERDKELFATGIHLIDQRRFGKWHLAGKWQYFPISFTEREQNPNL